MPYAHIIGYPLNRPRSVILWKKFFKKNKIKCKMTAKEVRSKNLRLVLKEFKNDRDFVASAVTMPYKQKVTKYFDFGDKISKFSNSINLIVKVNSRKIIGYNTDVLGAIETVKKLKKKNIMIFGLGGTGKAILKVFSKIYRSSKFIVVSSKNHKEFSNKKNIKQKSSILDKDLIKIDLFINCSPLGSNLKKEFLNKSPLSSKQILFLKKNVNIFDLVYKPLNTKLSKICKKHKRRYINGIKMNTFQAEKALSIIKKSVQFN